MTFKLVMGDFRKKIGSDNLHEAARGSRGSSSLREADSNFFTSLNLIRIRIGKSDRRSMSSRERILAASQRVSLTFFPVALSLGQDSAPPTCPYLTLLLSFPAYPTDSTDSSGLFLTRRAHQKSRFHLSNFWKTRSQEEYTEKLGNRFGKAVSRIQGSWIFFW